MKFARCLVGMVVGGVTALVAGCNSGHDCGEGTTEVDGVCVASGAGCGPGTVEQDGECVPDGTVICETGTTFDADSGTCVPDITGCAEGTVLVDFECVPEDEARQADVEEPAEPNDAALESDDFGTFDMPAEGEAVTIHGCIDPYRDLEPDGELDADYDAFVFQATEATVIDVTVDGVGGLTGAFEAITADEQLNEAGWFRLGVNLVGDTTQQQILLPKAGVYVLFFADSRTVAGGLAAGGPDACYFATVANVGIPAATAITDQENGILGGDVQVYSYDPASDGAVIENAVDYSSQSAAAAITAMVDGSYRSAVNPTTFGQSLTQLVLGLEDQDEVLLIIEPVINYSLTPVNTSLTVRDLGAVADPGDGTPITLTHDADDPVRLLFFEGSAGDIVRIQFDSAGAAYAIRLFPASATSFGSGAIGNICSGNCGQVDTWIQLQETGYYYLAIVRGGLNDGDTYDVAFTRSAVTPTAMAIDTPAAGDVAGDDRAFYEVTVGADDIWLEVAVENPVNLTDALVRFYQRDAAGQLDVIVPAVDGALTPFGRIHFEPGTYLVSVEDADGSAGDETFDLSIATKDFVHGGTLSSAAPLDLSAIETPYVYFRVDGDEMVSGTVTPTAGDVAIDVLDSSEDAAASFDAAGLDQPEAFHGFGVEGWIALRVNGAAGAYDLDADFTTLTPTTTTSEPALAFGPPPDDLVIDTLTVADPCSIVGLTVDVDITHAWRGDVELYLEGPDGTFTQLKASDPDDDGDDIVGTYPLPLELAGDLYQFVGLEGAGDWNLYILDTVPAFDNGVLNSWAVNLYCE